MPRVSVILTSFNHEKYIGEAIESVLNQTFVDFELIIWDDASSDGSWAIIKSYSDRRIRAFRNDENQRAIFGILKAIFEVATGDYIAMHHSDDVWASNKLETQVAYLDSHPEIGAVFSDALAIGEDGSALADAEHPYFNIFNQRNKTRFEWLRFFFSHGNALCHPSLLIRKGCYADCGAYRQGFGQLGDLDMWMRLCLKYEIHVVQEKLVRFRVRDNEANASGNRPATRIRWAYESYKLLQNYRKIVCFEDLIKVFPLAEKFSDGEETDLDFALAMVALEEKPFVFTPLFGLDLLLEIISDPKRSANVKRLYGFSPQSFIALTGRHDVFSGEGNAKTDGLIAEKDRLITALRIEIERIKSTASWQVTKPLRFFWNALSRLLGPDSARHDARRPPPAPPT
jgi:glycosyltransferase involved in cell wall biosynthesis